MQAIFIRLAVVASQKCEVAQNSDKIELIAAQGHPRSMILVPIEQTPIKNLGEKGATTSYYIRNGLSYEVQIFVRTFIGSIGTKTIKNSGKGRRGRT